MKETIHTFTIDGSLLLRNVRKQAYAARRARLTKSKRRKKHWYRMIRKLQDAAFRHMKSRCDKACKF